MSLIKHIVPRLQPTPREYLAFVLVAVLGVINALTDSFVSVRPGASRSDHLISAAVPIFLTLIGIWIYPRLVPGLRVAVALLFGALALIWGGIAVATAFAEGVTIGQAAGFLLIPAGAALVFTAVRVLLNSRKDGRFRYVRTVLYLVATLLAIYWVLLPLGMSVFATHRPQVPPSASDVPLGHENVVVTTADGLDLAAWYIPSKNGAAVITFPREWTTSHAAMLARHGYGVLMLDPRGYGESEGDPNAYGWGNTEDIAAAVAYLASRPDVSQGSIGGLGLSMGGEQMIEAAAGNRGLRAVVSEGAGERSVRESMMRGLKGALAIPAMAVQTGAVVVLSGHTPPPSLETLIGQIAPRPVFLIFSTHGGGGEELNPAYFAAANEPKQLWEIPEAGHTAGISAEPEEYERRVIGFFDQWLLGGKLSRRT